MSVNLVLFEGLDAGGYDDLWVTNGTAAGTSEISVAGAYSSGLFPFDLTVFGGEVLFGREDSSGDLNLWVTNGTAAGTSELSVAGTFSTLYPTDLTVFGGKVLFGGYDANNEYNLWVTNGTGAGTSELSVAGENSSGLLSANQSDLTVFGSEVLFNGIDASGGSGNLWVTNGTAAGTSELSVAGANSNGLDPAYLTVFGSEVLFNGYDSSGNSNLWVTNGTGSGTSELSVAGAYSAGGQPELDPSDLTVFGSKVLFGGYAANSQDGLWVSNGTAAGTSEISVAGVSPGGLFPSNLTVLGSEVLFEGDDANGDLNLWVTNGTAAGTSEISVAGANPNGLMPSNFAAYGSEVLFEGNDANDEANLWVTNGTAAGTSELAVAGRVLTGAPYLNPGYLTVFGGKVLFSGGDASGDTNLWVTNGTAAGTSELSVAGVYSGSLDPTALTAFGSGVLFDGTDAIGARGLWVTNGTVAGTSELSVAGANYSGVFYAGTPDLTVFGSKVLFNGADANGLENLWVSNGTAAGTSELSVAGADSNGLFNGGPPDLTVFGSKVLFNGTDANGLENLWVTNGTAAGTSELSVAGAYSSGLEPFWLTVFGSEVLFDGTDTSGFGGLWVSNGTAAGTSEISVAGVSPGGFDPTDLTVFGSKVLFNGRDPSGNSDLWVTNGTAAGTSEISVAGASSSGLYPSYLTVFGSEVLFNGYDANNGSDLWVTNGTAAGTSEISVAGADLNGLNPSNLTVFGSEVLFNGNDTGGDYDLWITNGTAAGTSEVFPQLNLALGPTDLTSFTPTTVIQTDGSTSLVEVGNDYYFYNSSTGSEVELKSGGSALPAGALGSWTPIGVVQTASGFDLAWSMPGANTFSIWTTDSSGNYLSSDGVLSGTSATLEAFEPVFGQDLNGGEYQLIQLDGSNGLYEVSNDYYFYNSSTGADVELKSGGAAIAAGGLGPWTPIGVVQTASGFDVAWSIPGANTFSIWTTDSSGNYVSSDGVLSGTGATLEAFEPVFNQNLNGGEYQLIQLDGTNGLYEVSNDYFFYNSSTGADVELKSGGSAIPAGGLGPWTPIGVVATSSGFDLAWSIPGANTFSIWITDGNGNYLSSDGVMSGSSAALEAFEPIFGQALNGGEYQLIQLDGTTGLYEVSNDYFFYNSSTGADVELKSGGAAIPAGALGSWTPIGVAQTATGFDLVWSIPGANTFSIWTTDSNGNYVSSDGVLSGTSATLEAFEPVFNQDLNGGEYQLIQLDGTTGLYEVANDYYFYNSSTGADVELKSGGSAIPAGALGSWTPIGVVQTASGFDLAWSMPGANTFSIWTTDSSGNYTSSDGVLSGTSATLEAFEPVFGQDLNGGEFQLIQTDGTTSLYEVSNDYYFYNSSTGADVELTSGGNAIPAGGLGPWTPIGAVATAGGFDLAWSIPGQNTFSIWTTDGSGNYLSSDGVLSGTSSTLEALEPTFGQDLNGDGVVGVVSGSGNSETTTIAAGATVEIISAYSGTATFTGSTGTLQLDNPSSFSGTVAGLTGTDTLDLKNINFATVQTPTYSGNSSGGALSVTDGVHSANIVLLGNYLSSTFVTSSDGHGGTNVVDPVLTSASQQAVLTQPQHA